MLGRKAKAKGIDLINNVADRFTAMVDELDRGAADCQAEREDIRGQIESLKTRDGELDSAVQKAATLAANLRTLMGV